MTGMTMEQDDQMQKQIIKFFPRATWPVRHCDEAALKIHSQQGR